MKQGRFAALGSPKILSFLKMCTLPESRKRPALRDFVDGRCALGCTFLYHSKIFERLYPGENAAKTPPNAACFPAGYPRPNRLRKSAHNASRADTGSVLRHEFFNALLFSRNVRSIEPLLIELLDDQLYRQDRIEQTSVLYSPILRDDRRALCEDEPSTLKLLYILAHGVAAHPDCIADGRVARMTLISFAVLYVKQITVDGNCSS